MKIVRVLSVVLIALVLLGCSLTVNVPTVETTTTKTLDISAPVPSGVTESSVEIQMGAGRLALAGGASNLVEGTVTYNVASWEPKVNNTSSGVVISQEHSTNVGIPENDIKNEWDLKLGQTPLALSIDAGAYEGTINLSGLSITNLDVSDGASKATIRFDSLNPVSMQHINYKTGASQVDLIGLGNANVSEITFSSGAGDYTLDFSGDLQKDLTVHVSSGMSSTKIVVPNDCTAIVEITGGLSNVDLTGTWTVNGSVYTAGTGSHTIHVYVEMAMGNLALKQQ